MKRLNLNYLVSVENSTSEVDIPLDAGYIKKGTPFVKMSFTNGENHYILLETNEEAIKKVADITRMSGFLILP